MATASTPIVIADLDTFRTAEVEKRLLSHSHLAVDTEFFPGNEGREFSLIQIATPEKEVYLFDVLENDELVKQLRGIMTSTDILKVMQGCENDSRMFWQDRYKWIELKHVFDTQLTQRILNSMKSGNPINKTHPGLAELCDNYGVTFDRDLKDETRLAIEQSHGRYFRSRNTDGSIPEAMKTYAVQDVIVLIDLFSRMRSLLEEDIQPLYSRLINSSLYAGLGGIENRWSYQKDLSLFTKVARPQLFEEINVNSDMFERKESFKQDRKGSGRRS